MENDQQTPPLTTWLLAAIPVLVIAAYYNPAAEIAAGCLIIGGGSLGIYSIARWAVARAKGMGFPRQ
ncbi:MAG: hypothetical protein QM608_02945 [Caulobacter sp.]